MAVRKITDADGTGWDVYDVVLPPDLRPGQAQRNSADSGRFRVPTAWLCFESASEKRRLNPIPDGWEAASADTLIQLLSAATKVKPA